MQVYGSPTSPGILYGELMILPLVSFTGSIWLQLHQVVGFIGEPDFVCGLG